MYACRFLEEEKVVKKTFIPMNITQNKNEDSMKLLMSQLQQRFAVVAQGGGKKAIEKQREKNKLTARERIEYLRDADKPFVGDCRICRL